MQMSFPAAMTWFFSTAAFILATFAFVEKFSSKEDLENYYLLITVNRFKFSAQWYLLLIKFVDLFFGFHTVYGRLMLPFSTSRCRLHGLHHCVRFFGLRRVDFLMPPQFQLPSRLLLAPQVYIIITCNFLFYYFNFLKTRLVLTFVARHRTFYYILFGVFLEISLLILLYSITVIITSTLYIIIIQNIDNIEKVMQFVFPDSIFRILHRDISYISLLFHLKVDQHQNMVELGFNDALNTNIIAASLSTIIIILFIVATIASYVANNISMLQQFLDRHTPVLNMPIQTLGAMVVVLFAVLFWTWFGLHQLVGPH